jgi:hypothetical protein
VVTRDFIERLDGQHALSDAAPPQETRRPEPDCRGPVRLGMRKLQVKDRLRAREVKSATEHLQR